MFVLGVQHSDSIFLWNVLYLKVSQDKDYLSLCCILYCSSLFLLQIVVCVSYSPTPILPLPPPSLHWELLVLCTVSQFQCRRLAGDPGLIPGSGRTPGGGNGNPLKYSCLENPMDMGSQRVRHNWTCQACGNLLLFPLVINKYLLESVIKLLNSRFLIKFSVIYVLWT